MPDNLALSGPVHDSFVCVTEILKCMQDAFLQSNVNSISLFNISEKYPYVFICNIECNARCSSGMWQLLNA